MKREIFVMTQAGVFLRPVKKSGPLRRNLSLHTIMET